MKKVNCDVLCEDSKFYDFFATKNTNEFGNYEVTDEDFENLLSEDDEEDIFECFEDGIEQFDIDNYKEGMPLVTRDGHKARILCTDLKRSNNNIVYAILDEDDYEIIRECDRKGSIYTFFTSRHDLFFKVA